MSWIVSVLGADLLGERWLGIVQCLFRLFLAALHPPRNWVVRGERSGDRTGVVLSWCYSGLILTAGSVIRMGLGLTPLFKFGGYVWVLGCDSSESK